MSREMSNPITLYRQQDSTQMTFDHVWNGLRSISASGVLALALWSLGATASTAHPDYWVSVKYRLSFGEAAVTQFTLDWTFDVFASSQIIDRYDLNQDRAFSAQEARDMQDALFAAFDTKGYFVKVFSGDTAQAMKLVTMTPRVEGDQLAISFTLVPEAPLRYRDAPLSFATHDEAAYHFSLSESDFLGVDGAFDTSCRFRVQTGKGLLEGIPQTIMLLCPE